MNDDRITFESLNAYVDGELDAAAAAMVARAVAENPVLARQVSALSRLRLAVAASVEAPRLKAPAEPLFGGRLMAVAAVVSLALFMAGSALVSGLDRPLGSDWLARAWQLHRSWSVETAAPAPELHLAEYADVVPGAYVPDLTASRLAVAHAAIVPFGDGHSALIVGYRGTRGCKVSLIMFADAPALGGTIESFVAGHDQAYAWRIGPLAYVIVSDTMDRGRFAELAKSVHQASRRHLPFDNKTRLALRMSRDHSSPCLT